MELSMRFVLVFVCSFCTGSFAIAQDERTFQAYIKQAQRYESDNYFKQALDSYHKAQSYASPEARKLLDKNIERVDELLQEQQLVNEGLANEIRKKIDKLASESNRIRIRDDLERLQKRDDALKTDYQQLMRQVEATKQLEAIAVKKQAASQPTKSTPQPPAQPVTVAHLPNKVITISMPKMNTDVKTTKSAGSLLNNTSKPKP